MIGQIFTQKNGIFLSFFFCFFNSFSLQKEEYFWKIGKKRTIWTDFWLTKRQILDRFLTLQHICTLFLLSLSCTPGSATTGSTISRITARFARIDLQIRANRLILANRLKGSRTEPLSCESRFGALTVANHRFEAIRGSRSNEEENLFLWSLTFLRIDSRESPRPAMRIAGLLNSCQISGCRKRGCNKRVCLQTQTKARKRAQKTQTNADFRLSERGRKRRQTRAKASKRRQTRTNAKSRNYTPFTHPLLPWTPIPPWLRGWQFTPLTKGVNKSHDGAIHPKKHPPK